RAFQEETPYIFAIVQLNEGPRIPTNLLECEIDGVELEMPVEVVFDDVTDDVTLVKFKPA
ncbi:MAG TPA: nucleic acid-binding protein, partial [Dehalococcoidia bacterium]|nr:nucleic acid-binding protein [Dehalococcoidia bacterium]